MTSSPEPRSAAVLVTRPQPGASRTAARLADLGFATVLAPALVVRALPMRLTGSGRFQAILVTSANALPALPKAWHACPIFTVGAATAAGARAAGFTQIHTADGDAAALAALVTQHCRAANGPLLLLSGRGQGHALATALRGHGFGVSRRVVYAAVPAPALPNPARTALLEGRIGHALFFSAESARAFLRQVQRAGLKDCLSRIEAIAIGQPAQMALKTVPWRRIRVAARPTQDAMLECLK